MSAGPRRGRASRRSAPKKAKSAKRAMQRARVSRAAAESTTGSAGLDLLAAQSGWGTAVRYGLLRAVDRGPTYITVLTSAGVGALLTSWAKALT